MPSSRNDPQTIRMMKPGLVVAIRYVVKEIKKINEGAIDTVVYGACSSTLRTMRFRKAWKYTAHAAGNGATGIFSYDPGKMGVHASLRGGGGVGAGLIEIIYQGLAGDIGFGPPPEDGGKRYAFKNPMFSGRKWAGSRNAWAELRKEVTKDKIFSLFGQGLSAAGFQYVPKSSAIGERIFDEP